MRVQGGRVTDGVTGVKRKTVTAGRRRRIYKIFCTILHYTVLYYIILYPILVGCVFVILMEFLKKKKKERFVRGSSGKNPNIHYILLCFLTTIMSSFNFEFNKMYSTTNSSSKVMVFIP